MKFKVGNKVKCIDSMFFSFPKVGRTYIIRGICPRGRLSLSEPESNYRTTGCNYHPKMFRLVGKTNPNNGIIIKE